jgi:hypothetical protein
VVIGKGEKAITQRSQQLLKGNKAGATHILHVRGINHQKFSKKIENMD